MERDFNKWKEQGNNENNEQEEIIHCKFDIIGFNETTIYGRSLSNSIEIKQMKELEYRITMDDKTLTSEEKSSFADYKTAITRVILRAKTLLYKTDLKKSWNLFAVREDIEEYEYAEKLGMQDKSPEEVNNALRIKFAEKLNLDADSSWLEIYNHVKTEITFQEWALWADVVKSLHKNPHPILNIRLLKKLYKEAEKERLVLTENPDIESLYKRFDIDEYSSSQKIRDFVIQRIKQGYELPENIKNPNTIIFETLRKQHAADLGLPDTATFKEIMEKYKKSGEFEKIKHHIIIPEGFLD